MTRVSITHLSNAHNRWLRSLNFYRQEISILKGLLTEIAGKNTDPEAMKEVEHYENQFKVQLDNIDRLEHDISSNLSKASQQAEASSARYIDESIVTRHDELGQSFETEEKIINELRHAFHRFAAGWM